VVDSGTNRVSEFSSTGKLLAQWGQSGTGSGEFAYPSYVAVDDAGNVYVSDTDNGRIQRLAVTR
jgi:DNA-binding beta-propeller fold protein YncE